MNRQTTSTRRRIRRLPVVAACLLATSITAACSSGSGSESNATSTAGSSSHSTTPVKLRIATSLVDSMPWMAMLQVSIDKGWFKEQGLDVQLVSASGGGSTLQTLTGGAADLAITGPDAVIKLVQQSGDSYANIGPWFNYNIVQWMAKDSNVSLKGATLGITGAGSTGEMIGKAVIADKPDDGIKLVVAGGLGAQWAAAKSGKISGAYSAIPASTGLKQEGAAVLVSARDVVGDIPMDMVAVSKKYAAQHPDAVKAFWSTVDRAWTYVREDTAAAATDVNKIIKMDESVLLEAMKGVVAVPSSYSIKVDCDALYKLSDVMIKGGVFDKPIDWTTALDQQYLPEKDQASCSGS